MNDHCNDGVQPRLPFDAFSQLQMDIRVEHKEPLTKSQQAFRDASKRRLRRGGGYRGPRVYDQLMR